MVASLVGDPARANMLTALMAGKALTAGELATEAGVTPQTATAHLAKLTDGGLIARTRQGRHRYFHLAGGDVAEVLEALMGLAARAGHMRTRTGPKDPALRQARICYDHLAGEMGVRMMDSLAGRNLVRRKGDEAILSDEGETFLDRFGVDVAALKRRRRPLCRPCLDWSARRDHLAGAAGAGVLARMLDLGWARRLPGGRVIQFSANGRSSFHALFPLQSP